MYVIIKNINSDTTIDDLENFILPVIKGRFFQRKGKINALKIIQLVNKQGAVIDRYGLVRVSPDRIKKRLIMSLNGQFIGEQKVSVDQYAFRNWKNDRRDDSTSPFLVARSDKRVSDRRRPGLSLDTLSEKLRFQ